MRRRILALLAALAVSCPAFSQTAVIQGGHHFPTTTGVPTVCHDVIGSGASGQWCGFAAMSAAQLNPLVQLLDSGIIFNRGVINSGSFVLGPYSNTGVGLRMTTTGATFTGTFTSSGTLTSTGSATFNETLPSSGTILSPFNIQTGTLGTTQTAGNDYPLGAFSTTNGNQIHLSARAHVNVSGTTSWVNAAYCLSADVDATEGAAGSICFYNGFAGIGPANFAPTHTLETGGTFYAALAATLNDGVTVNNAIATFNAGANIVGNTTHSGSVTIGGGTAILTSYELAQNVVAATMTGSTLSVGGANCNDSVALTITGATGGDVCAVGPPPAGSGTQLTVSCYCSATNACKLRFCNSGSVSNTINTGYYRLRTFGQ